MSDAALPVAPVSVWVQLLVGKEKQGESFEIEQTPRNVDALKNAVKDKWGGDLSVAAPKLNVFAPGADPKTETALKANALVPSDATYENPLIVVAPEADGELRCCSCIFSYSMLLQIRKSLLTF